MVKRELGMQLSSMCCGGDLSHVPRLTMRCVAVPARRRSHCSEFLIVAFVLLLASGSPRPIAVDGGRPRQNATLRCGEEVPSVPYPAR